MKMSDVIADFIGEMLSNGGGVAELQRKSLADRFSCVPSQINYVIETRFTPENGYLVESQRGGGGFIRIIRLPQYRILINIFYGSIICYSRTNRKYFTLFIRI